MATADYMLAGGRNFYAVFMCHLAVEKALKGLYQHRLSKVPPKTHSLTLLLNRVGLEAPAETHRFLLRLNETSVAARYPEELAELKRIFDDQSTRQLLERGRETIVWIKKQF
jgi:HEPN domain-containing protein